MVVTIYNICWYVVLVSALLQHCLCVAIETFCVLRGASGFVHCLVIPLSPPPCRRCAQAKCTFTDFIQQVKYQPSNLALNSVKQYACKPSSYNYLAKIYATLIKTMTCFCTPLSTPIR